MFTEATLYSVVVGLASTIGVLLRVLFKVYKSHKEATNMLITTYKVQSEKLTEVVMENKEAFIHMKTSVDANTKAVERQTEATDKLKDFITQHIIRATK